MALSLDSFPFAGVVEREACVYSLLWLTKEVEEASGLELAGLTAQSVVR
jgi:hypothetical protein